MAKLLLKYIAIHSMPLKVITDNGPECANQLMTELAYLLGMKQTKISPYNSKANGKVENIHKTVKTMLCAYMKEFKTNWDLLLPLVEFAMNTSRNVNTGYTPFFLHFGRHLNMPLEIKLRLLVTETSRNRKKKENRGKIDSHQARLLQRKESRWNIYYDVSIKNPHPNSLISINRVFSHK